MSTWGVIDTHDRKQLNGNTHAAGRGKSGRESDLPPPGVSEKSILGTVTLLETWAQTLP